MWVIYHTTSNQKQYKTIMARKKRIARTRKTPKQVRGPAPSGLTNPENLLTPCARLYAEALVDPWNTPCGACVPDENTNVTRRAKYFYRANFTIGSGGYGFAAVNPAAFAFSNYDSVAITSSAFAGSAISQDLTETGVVGGSSNSEFEYASNDDIKYRIVAGGIRWCYTGSELVRGGSCVALMEPQDSGLEGSSEADIAAYQETRICSAGNRDWDCVLWQPVAAASRDFLDGIGNAAANNAGTLPLAVVLSGTPSGGGNGNASYTVEIVFHYEWIGSNVTGKEPSHADVPALAAALTVMKQPEYTGGGPTKARSKKSFLGKVARQLLAGASGLGRFIVKNKEHLGALGGALAAIAL